MLPILDWHVIYVNPRLGIIADAASNLLWKIDEAARPYFPEVFADFCTRHFYHEKEATCLQLEYSPPSRCGMPLITDRVFRRVQTTFTVGRKAGWKASCRYQIALHRHNSLLRCGSKSNDDQLMQQLQLRLMGNKDPLKTALIFIKANLNSVSKWDALDVWKCISNVGETLYYKLEDPSQVGKVLQDLEAIQNLGPKAHCFSSKLQSSLLAELNKYGRWGSSYPSHIIEKMIPALLDLRLRSYGPKYDIDSMMNDPKPTTQQIPYYQLLIRAGANVNGNQASFEHGHSPLQQALWNQSHGGGDGDEEVIKFLRSQGALEKPKSS